MGCKVAVLKFNEMTIMTICLKLLCCSNLFMSMTVRGSTCLQLGVNDNCNFNVYVSLSLDYFLLCPYYVPIISLLFPYLFPHNVVSNHKHLLPLLFRLRLTLNIINNNQLWWGNALLLARFFNLPFVSFHLIKGTSELTLCANASEPRGRKSEPGQWLRP